MKKEMNLIPAEMVVSGKTAVLIKKINKITVICSVLLVLSFLAIASLSVFYKLEFNKVTASNNQLKIKIANLETSEQQLVLAKDRLSKILAIKESPSVGSEIDKFKSFQSETLVSNESTSSALVEASLDTKKTEVSFVFGNSDLLISSFDLLAKNTNYKKIVMTSLGYNPKSGFMTSFKIEK